MPVPDVHYLGIDRSTHIRLTVEDILSVFSCRMRIDKGSHILGNGLQGKRDGMWAQIAMFRVV
jgi:hypothetical protein